MMSAFPELQSCMVLVVKGHPRLVLVPDLVQWLQNVVRDDGKQEVMLSLKVSMATVMNNNLG